MPELPDLPGGLDYHSVEELREMAIQLGYSEGRKGWGRGIEADINNMDKPRVTRFIIRNHYKTVR